MDKNETEDIEHYQVLARKYRPSTFSDLIGQETMVRILKNAFCSDRIAHAFMLTGVRGVGKTTTARIIAKGLNCVGFDGAGRPSTEPCGLCENCTSISLGQHIDVLEIDAASRTGVADIRELIDTVYYRAASARYKVYIIDEVHMLSTSAFNALLKTLEEPPDHAKFIFATTEAQKVPATVLSRCQKFDLRRIEPQVMIDYLSDLASKEDFKIDNSSLVQIARASEGSVRDALSLLEQVVIDNPNNVTIEKVRIMLGLSDRGRNIDLIQLILSGRVTESLELFKTLYGDGADVVVLIKDLAEIIHWITILKVNPDLSKDSALAPDERDRGLMLSQKINMRVLSRMWQLLLKLLEEMKIAPNVKIAAEMGIIRLAHISELPSPDELLRSIKNEKKMNAQMEAKDKTLIEKKNNQDFNVDTYEKIDHKNSSIIEVSAEVSTETNFAVSEHSNLNSPAINIKSEEVDILSTFDDLIDCVRKKRNVDLLIQMEDNLRVVSYQIGRIEVELTKTASAELTNELAKFLKEYTGERWIISIVSKGGGKTIQENKEKQRVEIEEKSKDNNVVAKILNTFPGSKISKVTRAHCGPQSNGNRLHADDENFSSDWEPIEKE